MNKKKIKIILMIIFITIIMIIFIINRLTNKYYLELMGNDITISLGEKYIEPGYKAYDSNGKDLKEKVVVESNINIDKIGEYTISYQLNNKKIYRKVYVINKNILNEDKTNLILNLIGDETIYIPKNEEYKEQGVVVTDLNGNSISSEIIIQGEVNTQIPNTYIITYSVENQQITRKVIVYELQYQYYQSCTTDKCTINLTFNDYYYDKVLYPSGITSKEKFINYIITQNGTYRFTIYDKYGYTIIKEVTINEIVTLEDKTPPKEEEIVISPQEPITNNAITDNLFVGDSRTVGMCQGYKLCGKSEYIAEVSKNYSWFQKKAIEAINTKIKNKDYNIIILMGVNDVGRTESNGKNQSIKYYETISSLATTTWKNQNVIFVSVNPVIDGYSDAYTEAVNAFNNEIKSKILSSDISNLKYCDTNSKLNITTSNAKDGLHYNEKTYQQIYNIIIKECLSY